MSSLNWTVEESNGKTSTLQVRCAAAPTPADIGTLDAAIRPLILGKVRKGVLAADNANITIDADAAPTTAQRGNKWFIRGLGADGENYSLTIPTADSTDITDGDRLDTAAGLGATLKTELEKIWKDKAGTAVTVLFIEFRNYYVQ